MNQLHVQQINMLKISSTENAIYLMRAEGRRQDVKAVKGKLQTFTKSDFLWFGNS